MLKRRKEDKKLNRKVVIINCSVATFVVKLMQATADSISTKTLESAVVVLLTLMFDDYITIV